MKFSICITSMGRLHHIKKALPVSLKNTECVEGRVEFILLDYNSKDGLADWVRTNMGEALGTGRLTFYREATASHYFPAHARNVAHSLATGEFVGNLDADNFVLSGYMEKLAETFAAPPFRVVVRHKVPADAYGRVMLRRAHFWESRGYDERFIYPYGGHDTEYHHRMERIGFTEVRWDLPWDTVIHHLDEERVCNGIQVPGLKTPNDQSHINIKMIRQSPPLKIMNPDGWGKALVYKNFSDVPIQTGVD